MFYDFAGRAESLPLSQDVVELYRRSRHAGVLR